MRTQRVIAVGVGSGDLAAARRAAADLHLELVEEPAWAAARARVASDEGSILLVDPGSAGVADWPAAVLGLQGERPGAVAVVLGEEPAEPPVRRALPAVVAEVVPRGSGASRIEGALARACYRHELGLEVGRLRTRLRGEERPHGLAGPSAASAALRDAVDAAASSESPVVVVGEPGSGRRQVARAIHAASPRASNRFLVIDCAARDDRVLADDLFGRGGGEDAPPSAGAFEAARGGTVVLHDVPALRPALQQRLAGVLRDGRFPARGDRAVELDARVLATAGPDVARAVAAGELRDDLWRHLSGRTLRIEPLRQRPDDVAAIAADTLATLCALNGIEPLRLSRDALDALRGYDWPGQARELRDALEQAAIVCRDGVVRPDDLPERIRERAGLVTGPGAVDVDRPFREAKRRVVDRFEREYLSMLMSRNGGNVTSAAARSGMLRSALQRLLRKHRLRSSEFRRARPRDADAAVTD